MMTTQGWRSRSLVTAAMLGALVWAGCAEKAAGPGAGEDVAAAPLSEAEAAAKAELEQVFQNIFDVPDEAVIDGRLREPKTVQDAQDVVRSDNIALYPKADKVFSEYLKSHADDVTNRTWHAQLYLAWSDSATVTRHSLARSLERPPAGREWIVPLTEKVMDELDAVAAEKLQIGAEKSLAILKDNQETYEGYRLAADLFRLQKDWSQYEGFIKKLEAKNPDSTGLRFLKGVVAFQRDKDYHTAERFLIEAVSKDAKFTKAQYYLALTYLNMRHFDRAGEALDKTLEISPGHPFANAMRGYVARVRE